jgi:hypothetical protein
MSTTPKPDYPNLPELPLWIVTRAYHLRNFRTTNHRFVGWFHHHTRVLEDFIVKHYHSDIDTTVFPGDWSIDRPAIHKDLTEFHTTGKDLLRTYPEFLNYQIDFIARLKGQKPYLKRNTLGFPRNKGPQQALIFAFSDSEETEENTERAHRVPSTVEPAIDNNINSETTPPSVIVYG